MGCCSSKPTPPPAHVPRKLRHVKPLIEKTEHSWSVDVMKGEGFKFMEPFCLYPQHGLEVPQFANNSSTADFVFECVAVPAFELARTMSDGRTTATHGITPAHQTSPQTMLRHVCAAVRLNVRVPMMMAGACSTRRSRRPRRWCSACRRWRRGPMRRSSRRSPSLCFSSVAARGSRCRASTAASTRCGSGMRAAVRPSIRPPNAAQAHAKVH